MTTETTVATVAGQDRRQAAISQAARHLYDAETALHTARQSGVGAWISAAYGRLSEAIADHTRRCGAPGRLRITLLNASREPPLHTQRCARTAARRALICRPTGGPRSRSRLGIRTPRTASLA